MLNNKEYMKKWRADHKKHLQEYMKDYRSNHAKQLQEYDRRHRLLIKYGKQAVEWFEKYLREIGICQKCKIKLEVGGYSTKNTANLHHIDWDKTNNDISNLAVLCQICHRQLATEIILQTPKNVLKKVFEQWI